MDKGHSPFRVFWKFGSQENRRMGLLKRGTRSFLFLSILFFRGSSSFVTVGFTGHTRRNHRRRVAAEVVVAERVGVLAGASLQRVPQGTSTTWLPLLLQRRKLGCRPNRGVSASSGVTTICDRADILWRTYGESKISYSLSKEDGREKREQFLYFMYVIYHLLSRGLIVKRRGQVMGWSRSSRSELYYPLFRHGFFSNQM